MRRWYENKATLLDATESSSPSGTNGANVTDGTDVVDNERTILDDTEIV
jgi:hypothetical protein